MMQMQAHDGSLAVGHPAEKVAPIWWQLDSSSSGTVNMLPARLLGRRYVPSAVMRRTRINISRLSGTSWSDCLL
jgi:hypothetical protein